MGGITVVTQDQLELRRKQKARDLIAMAENLYVNDFEPTRFNKPMPTFTETQARAFLNERQAYWRRWTHLGALKPGA
jgi:hypothetical protein